MGLQRKIISINVDTEINSTNVVLYTHVQTFNELTFQFIVLLNLFQENKIF